MPKRLQIKNIRLEDELKAKLKKLAEKRNRPLVNDIVFVLREHVAATKGAEDGKK
jgi:predicted transcriptional regulator